MARILVLNTFAPYPVVNGNCLRVYHMYREVARHHTCHLAVLQNDAAALAATRKTGIFAEVVAMPNGAPPSSPVKHLLPTNAHMHKLGAPLRYRRIRAILSDIIRRRNVDALVGVTLGTAEFAAGLRGAALVLDNYDCATLTYQRQWRFTRTAIPWRRRLAYRVRVERMRRHESRLARDFDLITTISPVDCDCLQRLNPGARERIVVLPNGVDVAQFRAVVVPERDRAICFWGNLEYAVNQAAIADFLERVYVPHLEPQGVRWCIIGRNPTPEIQALPRRHAAIEVAGYVEDLATFVAAFPVVINPMVMGSGLKNKVLEAFAMRKAVVTTAMGVEALTVEAGRHCLVADTPEDFAAAVLRLLASPPERTRLGENARALVCERYDWRRIGDRMAELLDRVVAGSYRRPSR